MSLDRLEIHLHVLKEAGESSEGRERWRQVAPSVQLVRELAAMVDEPTASLLERALARETAVVALTIDDRERILRALEDCPDGLEAARRSR